METELLALVHEISLYLKIFFEARRSRNALASKAVQPLGPGPVGDGPDLARDLLPSVGKALAVVALACWWDVGSPHPASSLRTRLTSDHHLGLDPVAPLQE